VSLTPANPAQSRIEIGAWRLRKSKWSATLFVIIYRYEVLGVAARKDRELDGPRPEVLARLEGPDAATFRTDAHGGVSFYPDGRRVEPRLPGR